MINIKKLLLIIPLLLILCGCWDYTELNMQNYVLGMSVDYIDDKYLVCIETVKITGEPTSLSASQGIIIESEGVTVFDAVRDAIMSAGKKLYWGHAKVLIISEAVAYTHLPEVCDVLSRAHDIYSNISLCVAKDCLARDILHSKTPSDTLISEHISNIFENEEPSRRFISTQLWELLRDYPYTPLPTVYLADFPLVDGSAVIKNNRLIGFLNGTETQILSLIETSGSGGYLPQVNVDGVNVTLEILNSKLTTSQLYITVSLSGLSDHCDITSEDFQKKLCNAAEKIISEQIHAVITKPFGNPLARSHYDVHVKLNSTGLLRSAF